MAGLSVLVLAGTAALPAWADFTPGPGFFPRVIGAAGLGLAAADLAAALRGAAALGEGPGAAGLARVWLSVAGMAGFAALAPVLGMVPAVAALMAFLLTVVLRRRLLPSLAATAIVTLAIEAVFVRWLGVALPASPFLA
jgi:hypothetical protein